MIQIGGKIDGMKILRDYQSKGAEDGVKILRSLGIVYFSWSVRTGKSATALETCRLFGAKSVLFLTKKKAISSIQADYDEFGFADHFRNGFVVRASTGMKTSNPRTKADLAVVSQHIWVSTPVITSCRTPRSFR